jgi:RimJ/RimL family protein N-acetyltransferase
MSYKVEIVKRTSFSNLPLVAVIVYRIVLGKIIGERRLMYTLASSDLGKVKATETPNYVIECLPTWSDVHHSLRQELSQKRSCLGWDAEKLFDQGGTLWIGRSHGQLASAGWSRAGSKVRSWFFPLAPTWFVISHAITLPEFRGADLYPAMLWFIVRTLAGQGAERFFIDCNDWNVPSIRGIKKAGFQKIGSGVSKRNGHLLWYQVAKPDLTNS